MIEKKVEILQQLISNDKISKVALAANLCISTHTLNKYIDELNTEFNELISYTNGTCSIDKSIASKIINYNLVDFPLTKNSRILYILYKLLSVRIPSLDIDSICEELYISESTLLSMIPELKTILNEFGIKLRIKNNIILLIGDEIQFRNAISSVAYKKASRNIITPTILKSLFQSVDVFIIYNNLNSLCDKYELNLNDYIIYDLLQKLCICIERIQKGAFVTDCQSLCSNKITNNFLNSIIKSLNIQIPDSEYNYLSMLCNNYLVSMMDNLYNDLNSGDFKNLCNYITKKLKLNLGIDFKTSSNFQHFSIFLSQLINRLSKNIHIPNPSINMLKVKQPLSFNISVYIAYLIEHITKLHPTEDDIAFIAMEVTSLHDSVKITDGKLNVALIAPKYDDYSTKLFNLLTGLFKYSLNIQEMHVNELNLLKSHNIDLVISTIPLVYTYPYPTYNISLVPSKNELFELEVFIYNVRKIQYSKKINHLFDEYLLKNIHFHEISTTTKSKAIKYLIDALKQNKTIAKDITNNLLISERYTSNVYSKSTIVHPINMNSKHPFFEILVFKNGVIWDGKTINFLIAYSFSEIDLETKFVLANAIYTVFSNQNYTDMLITLDEDKLAFKNKFIEFLVK